MLRDTHPVTWALVRLRRALPVVLATTAALGVTVAVTVAASSDAGADRMSDQRARAVLAALDHAQQMVALGHTGEMQGTLPATRAQGRALASEAAREARTLDGMLRASGVDASERIRLRPTTSDPTSVLMSCTIMANDQISKVSALPAGELDAAFATAADAAVREATNLEAAAGIEPAIRALQAPALPLGHAAPPSVAAG